MDLNFEFKTHICVPVLGNATKISGCCRYHFAHFLTLCRGLYRKLRRKSIGPIDNSKIFMFTIFNYPNVNLIMFLRIVLVRLDDSVIYTVSWICKILTGKVLCLTNALYAHKFFRHFLFSLRLKMPLGGKSLCQE